MASTGDSRGESKSPKQRMSPASPPRPESQIQREPKPTDAATDVKPAASSNTNTEPAKPLAPPPRPGQQQQDTNTPDYFSGTVSGSLNFEPNPFEQSFGAPPETPGGTKLPPVAALTSPSSLLPGSGATPFGWGAGSLRTGPLSPAMLSGPTNDYFGDTNHIRGGFPTPNESSMRTGLTPGGSGSMFPVPSPNSQALFAQLATPGTIDFQRTAARARQQSQAPQPSVTSQPQDMPPNSAAPVKEDRKASAGHFDPHDNDAANGLFMLAQGRNNAPPQGQYPVPPQQQIHADPAPPPAPAREASTSPQMQQMDGDASAAGSSVRGGSESGSAASDDNDQARPNTRAKGKRNSTTSTTTTSGRRKADDTPAKAPANKKAKTNGNASSVDMDHSDEDSKMKQDEGGSKSKMTDEEKRKNFLERNRVAALKCRQRKKQWLANLQSKVEMFTSENDALTAQITQLREEVVNLKTLLLAHKDCPIAQQQGLHGSFMQQPMEPYNTQMNPYGMAAPLANQQVMAGQGVQRRFS